MSEDKQNRPKIQVEKVHNMTGSTAGAGSGEFHNYSLHKQRERSRLAAMDYEARQEQRKKKFEEKNKDLEEKSDKISERKRLVRLKKKKNKGLRKVKKLAASLNKFSNDGSFLEQFMKNNNQEYQNENDSDSESNSRESEVNSGNKESEPNLIKKVKPNEIELKDNKDLEHRPIQDKQTEELRQ